MNKRMGMVTRSALAALSLVALVGKIHAATLGPISDAAGLTEAINSASGGDTIELVGDGFGSITLWNKHFPSHITITSQDPSNPAILQLVKVNESSNIRFDNIHFDSPFSVESTSYPRGLEVNGSNGIEVHNSLFTGDTVMPGEGRPNTAGDTTLRRDDAIEGFYWGGGARFSRSDNIVFNNNEMKHFRIAVQFLRIKGLEVRENYLHHNRMDAFNFGEVENAVIERNVVTDLVPWTGPGGIVSPSVGDHADLIQFWSDNTDNPSRNVKILNNYLSSGVVTYYVQGIFIRNEKVDGGAWTSDRNYDNFDICGNYVENSHTHGITVGDMSNSNISNNYVIRNTYSDADGNGGFPSMNIKGTSSSLTVFNNVVGRLNLETSTKGILGADDNVSIRDLPGYESFRRTQNSHFVGADVCGERPRSPSEFKRN